MSVVQGFLVGLAACVVVGLVVRAVRSRRRRTDVRTLLRAFNPPPADHTTEELRTLCNLSPRRVHHALEELQVRQLVERYDRHGVLYRLTAAGFQAWKATR